MATWITVFVCKLKLAQIINMFACVSVTRRSRKRHREYEGLMQWGASVHVPEKYNEICGELLQRRALNDNLCPPSSNAFQRGNQRAPLARALGAGGNSLLVRSHQREPWRGYKAVSLTEQAMKYYGADNESVLSWTQRPGRKCASVS